MRNEMPKVRFAADASPGRNSPVAGWAAEGYSAQRRGFSRADWRPGFALFCFGFQYHSPTMPRAPAGTKAGSSEADFKLTHYPERPPVPLRGCVTRGLPSRMPGKIALESARRKARASGLMVVRWWYARFLAYHGPRLSA